MEGIETIGPETGPAIQIERGRIWHFWHRLVLEVWHWRLKRWIPRLVWLGDEIDVGVTFKNIGALGGTDPPCDQDAAVWDAQDAFRRMGIGFDTGSGCDGRDWEWDWSLKGPISIRFRGRAKHPLLRVVPEPEEAPPNLSVVH